MKAILMKNKKIKINQKQLMMMFKIILIILKNKSMKIVIFHNKKFINRIKKTYI